LDVKNSGAVGIVIVYGKNLVLHQPVEGWNLVELDYVDVETDSILHVIEDRIGIPIK
jgi:predicted Ser/Thr protein kinase